VSDSKKNVRKATRFRDDRSWTAVVDGRIPALAFSESATGCGLGLLLVGCPGEGDEVKVKVGDQAPLRGVVRWRKVLDNDMAKIGIEYLE
jgi:hypothetical protein